MEEVYIVSRGYSGGSAIVTAIDEPIIEGVCENKDDAIAIYESLYKEYTSPDTDDCEIEEDEVDGLPWADITCDSEDYHCYIKVEKQKIIRKNGLQR